MDESSCQIIAIAFTWKIYMICTRQFSREPCQRSSCFDPTQSAFKNIDLFE